MKIKINTLDCKKCGHKWVPRIKKVVQCPKCKSATFNLPFREKVSARSPD